MKIKFFLILCIICFTPFFNGCSSFQISESFAPTGGDNWKVNKNLTDWGADGVYPAGYNYQCDGFELIINSSPITNLWVTIGPVFFPVIPIMQKNEINVVSVKKSANAAVTDTDQKNKDNNGILIRIKSNTVQNFTAPEITIRDPNSNLMHTPISTWQESLVASMTDSPYYGYAFDVKLDEFELVFNKAINNCIIESIKFRKVKRHNYFPLLELGPT